MRIAVASDIHGLWFELEYPSADLLIFAGDILGYYAHDKRINATEQLNELEQLNLFLKEYTTKYERIIFVAGNHDFAFELFPDKARQLLTAATYLQDEATEFKGYKIYGSPWQPWFGGWAFNFKNHQENFYSSRAQRWACWGAIPTNTNILITHSPPLGILDETARGLACGCEFLKERLDELPELLLHVFGHIHASRGSLEKDGALYINAANCYTHNKIAHPIQIVEISDTGLAHVVQS